MSVDTKAFFFIAMGLVLTLLGVGGVENSMTTVDLLKSLAVSGLGLSFMWIATLILKTEGYR